MLRDRLRTFHVNLQVFRPSSCLDAIAASRNFLEKRIRGGATFSNICLTTRMAILPRTAWSPC